MSVVCWYVGTHVDGVRADGTHAGGTYKGKIILPPEALAPMIPNSFLFEGMEACNICVKAKEKDIDKRNKKCYEDLFSGIPLKSISEPEINHF